jgi:hypothetical protein
VVIRCSSGIPANPSWRAPIAEATVDDVDAAIDQNKKEPTDALVQLSGIAPRG